MLPRLGLRSPDNMITCHVDFDEYCKYDQIIQIMLVVGIITCRAIMNILKYGILRHASRRLLSVTD